MELRSVATVVVVSALGGMVGCGPTLKDRANSAFSKHRYLEAATLYDEVVRANPKDGKALARRTEARTLVLHELLGNASAARVAGRSEEAAMTLAELLGRRDGWGMSLADPDHLVLTVEVVAASSYIDGEIGRATTAAGPLSGEQRMHHYDGLLARADFARSRAQIAAGVTAAGRNVCALLAPHATTPSWSWIVARYCAHWQAPPVAVLPSPHLRSTLVVDGTLDGVADAETATVRATLADAFRDSVWFGADGQPAAHAEVRGAVAATFDQHTVSRTANWTESVPYTAYETTQESYQEPYDDTETYYEQVPHTEYQSQSRPCGDTTCTDTVPVTVYASEMKTRTVTRYRTAYRDVANPVTRYRDEPRSFTYEALERTGHYTSQLEVKVDEGEPAATAQVVSDQFEHGFDHDVSNIDAGVSPERANLTDLSTFLAHEVARLHDELKARLDDRYRQLYCSAGSFALEDAAVCAYLDAASAPAAVHATLASVFGADEPYLAALLRR